MLRRNIDIEDSERIIEEWGNIRDITEFDEERRGNFFTRDSLHCSTHESKLKNLTLFQLAKVSSLKVFQTRWTVFIPKNLSRIALV